MQKYGRRPERVQNRAEGEEKSLLLRLYIAGQTANSVKAICNLKQLCRKFISGEYDIEIIDLLQNPECAASDQIFAIPTLVRKKPQPAKKIIGDLSNTERVLNGLEIEK